MSSSGQLYLALYAFTLVSVGLVLAYYTWQADHRRSRPAVSRRPKRK